MLSPHSEPSAGVRLWPPQAGRSLACPVPIAASPPPQHRLVRHWWVGPQRLEIVQQRPVVKCAFEKSAGCSAAQSFACGLDLGGDQILMVPTVFGNISCNRWMAHGVQEWRDGAGLGAHESAHAGNGLGEPASLQLVHGALGGHR